MRDYKKEYARYQGKPEQIKRRSSRNKARRKAIRLGKARKGDGKDVHHRDNNPNNNGAGNLSVTSIAKNRGYPRDRNNKPKKGLSRARHLAARIGNLYEFARIRLKGGFMAETPASIGVRVGGPKKTYIIGDKHTAAEISVLKNGRREIHISNRDIPRGETGNNGAPLLRLLRKHTEHTKKRGRPVKWVSKVENPKLKKKAEKLYPKQTEFSAERVENLYEFDLKRIKRVALAKKKVRAKEMKKIKHLPFLQREVKAQAIRKKDASFEAKVKYKRKQHLRRSIIAANKSNSK